MAAFEVGQVVKIVKDFNTRIKHGVVGKIGVVKEINNESIFGRTAYTLRILYQNGGATVVAWFSEDQLQYISASIDHLTELDKIIFGIDLDPVLLVEE